MQFERSEAGSCELWRSRLHRALFVVCRECFCFGVVQSEFCFRRLCAESLQSSNKIGEAGAICLGEALMCNSSVRELNLVSCGDHVCIEYCLLCAGNVFVWCGAVGVLFSSSLR